MIALLVMTDGREYVHETIASAEANLVGNITERWLHDDSGDPAIHADLVERYGDRYTVHSTGTRSGFAGAIRSAWALLRERSTAPAIFHLEDDFTFRRPVDVDTMAAILEANPYLINLALRRQPWNDAERAAGGIVEQYPDAYTEVLRGGHAWLEHRLFFTTNPGLYRRRMILEHDWPDRLNSEGRFSHHLLNLYRDARFGYYGALRSGEAVEHIGHHRAGTGY